MILSCPNCYSQFNVDDDAIGVEGRKVKCSSCKEVWFQDPDPDWLAEKLAEQTERLEEQLSQDISSEDTSLSETNVVSDELLSEELSDIQSDDSNGNKQNVFSRPAKVPLVEIGIAASIFLFYLSYLFFNSGSIIQKKPEWLAFYNLFGVSVDVPKDRLTFDQIVANSDGKKISIRGNIANLASDPIDLYPIEVGVFNENEEFVASWIEHVDYKALNGEQVIEFETSYDVLGEYDTVNLRFVFGSHTKTDVEGDDSIQVRH